MSVDYFYWKLFQTRKLLSMTVPIPNPSDLHAYFNLNYEHNSGLFKKYNAL